MHLVLFFHLACISYWAISPVQLSEPAVDDEELETDTIEDDHIQSDKAIFSPLVFVHPEPAGPYYFADCFKDKSAFQKKWVVSKAKKDGVAEEIALYNGEWEVTEPVKVVLENDVGLIMKNKARHHAISAKLSRPFSFTSDKPLIVEYDVNFQNGHECGGGYVKLLSDVKGLNLDLFHDKTNYTIMFGPDKCGAQAKMHFIIRYRNPLNGVYEEKHAKQADKTTLLEEIFSDKKSHLVRLELTPDGDYNIQINQKQYMKGNLLESLSPSIQPPREVEDPNERKPEDWDDREKIVDPQAKKPDDWNEDEPEFVVDEAATVPSDWLEEEPEYVPDPKAVKPLDWDNEMDGEWEAPSIKNPRCESISGCGKWTPPKIKNPNYKGKWKAPLVSNPNYKGTWKPQKIVNPAYFEVKRPFENLDTIAAIGIELWTMTDGVMFDNFLITDSDDVANVWAMQSWHVKHGAENAMQAKSGFFGGLLATLNEKPWLWAVLLIIVLIPIILVVVFCCGGSSKDEALKKQKKTDASSPDDLEQESQDEQRGEEEEESEGRVSDAEKTSEQREKSATPKPSASPSKQKRDSPAKPVQTRATKKADLEEPEDESQSQSEGEEANAAKSSPRGTRRRGLRKD